MVRLLGLTLFVPAAAATFVALLTALVFLLPERIGRAQSALETTPGRVLVIGLVNFVFFGAIATLMSQGGDFTGLIGFIILLALFGLALVGLGGQLSMLRMRLYASASDGASLPAATLKSALLLVLAMLAPIAGWFLLTPILLLMGLGAGIIAFMRRAAPTDASGSY